MVEKRDQIAAIARKYNTDLITAALHFVLAADEFASIIPGASSVEQVNSNLKAWKSDLPVEFWKELKAEGLIYEKAQIPE